MDDNDYPQGQDTARSVDEAPKKKEEKGEEEEEEEK